MGAFLALTLIVFQANNQTEDRTGVNTSTHAVEHGADIADYQLLCSVAGTRHAGHCLTRDVKPNGESEDK